MEIILIFFAFILVMIATTIPTSKRKDMSWMKGVSSHRGWYQKDQSVAENSMTAIRKSIDMHLDIELDVRITADQKLIVFHDKTLERMCDVDLDVEASSFEELSKFDLGKGHDRIPLFIEVLKEIAGKVNLIIEIKPTKRVDEVCSLLSDELDGYNGKFAVCSFDPKIIAWFRKNKPHYIRGQIIMSFLNDARLPWINRILLSINGFNFNTRSDFVSVHYSIVHLFTWMRVFKGVVCTWTISDNHWYTKLYGKVDHLIIEHIDHVK